MKHSELKQLIKEEIESFIKRNTLSSIDAKTATYIMDEYEVFPDSTYYNIAKELGTTVQSLKFVSLDREDPQGRDKGYNEVADAHYSNKSSLIKKKIGNAHWEINPNTGTAEFTTPRLIGYLFVT